MDEDELDDQFWKDVLGLSTQTTSGVVSNYISQLFGDASTEGFKGIGSSSYETSGSKATEDGNVFSRMFDTVTNGVSEAWKKDPLAFLQGGAGVVAGVIKDASGRDASQQSYDQLVAMQGIKSQAELERQRLQDQAAMERLTAQEKSAMERLTAQNQASLEQQNNAARIKQEAAQRYSDSITAAQRIQPTRIKPMAASVWQPKV